MNITVEQFIKELSSNSPVSGGGGASAMIGAIGVSLCSMVANLTIGKKKYAEYEEDMEQIVAQSQKKITQLLACITKDAEAFLPLSEAYSIPKEDKNRDEILEKALINACTVPMELLRELSSVIQIMEELAVKGSKLAISDVAIAACALKSAMEGAIVTVYINTKQMKDKEYALNLNQQASGLLSDGVMRCERVFQKIADELKKLG